MGVTLSMSTPSTPSPTVRHSLGPAVIFVLLFLLAALVIIGLMRVVTPVKERLTNTSPSAVSTTTAPRPPIIDDTDGKPGAEKEEASNAVRPPSVTPTPEVATSTKIIQPKPAGATCDAGQFICVTLPEANAVISNPTTIEGTAIAFENTAQYELQDGRGTVLVSGSFMTNAPDAGEQGAFQTRLFWNEVPATVTGTLLVFESSARDGQPIHVVRVPVRFTSVASVSRALYLAPKQSGASTDCSEVYKQIVSLPATNLPVEATLRALLAFDSIIQKHAYPGYTTIIPLGTKVVSLKVANGVATVVLSREVEGHGGGSCAVTAIRSQIESTLKQFSSVQSVVLSVEGKTPAESLQP